jgi:hypothetical protein
VKKILVAAALCLILVCLMVSPVLAADTHTYDQVSGVEVAAGSYDALTNTTNGAHFIAVASITMAKKWSRPVSSGILDVHVNYLDNGPNTTGDRINTITGGNWTLTVTTGEKKGIISGIITPTGSILQSKITWETYKNNPIGRGWAEINLSINGGTNDFANIAKGSGSTFTGYDVHMSGFWLFGIQVPTVEDGTLKLVY